MKYRILVTGKLHPLAEKLFSEAPDVEADLRPDTPYEEVLALVKDYHAIVSRSETKITRELIDAAPKLKVIARAAVGIGNIDVDYATEKGILVINTPGKNTNSAAELTFGLLLSVIRNIIEAHGTMQRLEWNRHQFTGVELQGKTIGIIGLGNVGHRVARFARSFDMEILAYDPYISDEVFEANHAHKVELAEMIARADVITLHTPQTPETTGIIGAKEIAAMKDGVILLNTARGGLVDEAALLEALKSGKVAAAGVDTWEVEPPQDNPFRDMPQVVMTPHIGASTTEAQVRIAESIADQTLRGLRDEVVDYPVNMPRVNVITDPRTKHYTVLAEKLGSFAIQMLDFNPRHIRVMYRGELNSEDGAMIRRAFLRGFLKRTSDQAVTFVNAEAKAAERQIQVEDVDDPTFTDYPSAINFVITDHEKQFSVGGVVFGANNYRLSRVNDFLFEVMPDGYLLSVVNNDRPGVIGDLGTILAKNNVNISQFELSRNMPGGQAMSLLRVDSQIDDETLQSLRDIANVVSVRRIEIA